VASRRRRGFILTETNRVILERLKLESPRGKKKRKKREKEKEGKEL